MSKPFQFQQFHIYHDQCGHKVGTDSLILGAWVGQELRINPQNILDIGTGSGVLALMMAQHYPKAQIEAVEIEENAFLQAQQNFANNQLGQHIRAHHSNIQSFHLDVQYDVIITNPPFFKSTSKAAKENRQNARSQDQLTIQELFESGSKQSHKESIMATVFPKDLESTVINKAEKHGWYPQQILYTYSDDRDPNRFFVIWSRSKVSPQIKSIPIRKSGKYTNEYIDLTKDFHNRKL